MGRAIRNAVAPGPGRAGSPLLPAAWRRPAAVSVAVCVSVTLLLGVIVHGRASADVLDRTIDPWLHRSIGRHRAILSLVSLPGAPLAGTVLAAALVVACLVARRWRAAALVAVAVLAASTLTEFVLKVLVGRRAGDGTGSFPSGHAVGVFSLAVAVCVLLAQPPRPKPAIRRLLAAGALLAATAASVAMVGLHHHYFTDVIGGAAVGTAVVLLTAFALDRLLARQRPQHGPPALSARSAPPRDTPGMDGGAGLEPGRSRAGAG